MSAGIFRCELFSNSKLFHSLMFVYDKTNVNFEQISESSARPSQQYVDRRQSIVNELEQCFFFSLSFSKTELFCLHTILTFKTSCVSFLLYSFYLSWSVCSSTKCAVAI